MLQELAVCLRREVVRPLDSKEIRKIVTELQEWEVFVNNGESVLRALEIEQQYQILYTEDLNDGQVFGGVWVVNPFKS